MDFYRNVSVSSDYHQQEQLLASPSPCSKLGTAALAPTTSPLDDLFSAQNTEVDVSLEWLSVFVEDCLTSTGNCLPAQTTDVLQQTNTAALKNPPPSPKPLQQKPQEVEPSSLKKLVIPGKARSKRKRVTTSHDKTCRNPLTSWYCYAHQQQPLNFASSDPPMLQQTYWLADSELIMPKKEEESTHRGRDDRQVLKDETGMEMEGKVKENLGNLDNNSGAQQPRRCTHCLSQRTPQWRAGPLGPKTLCNACGVRYKSGRLLPEYRPAKSPTFVSYLHSNSHKKVLEMRMASSVVFNS